MATLPSSSTTRHEQAHSTGVASGRWSTYHLALYGLFVALAMAVSFIEFPLLPGVPWLKYDPSGIVCLTAGFAFGPMAAVIVSLLGFLPHLLTNPVGALIAMLLALTFSVPAAYLYRKNPMRAGALIAMLLSSALTIVVAIVVNLLISPLYFHLPMQTIAAMILPILLPFNLLKFILHDIVTLVIYKPISQLLYRNSAK